MTDQEPPEFHGIPTRGCRLAGVSACVIIHTMDAGEQILVEREPTNPVDKNAIKVIVDDDDFNGWFGYVGREYAAEIAPWMDRGVVFMVYTTDRVGCSIILSFIPLRSKKESQETERDRELEDA